MVETVDPFEGGKIDGFEVGQGPRWRITSVVYKPMMDSARALS